MLLYDEILIQDARYSCTILKTGSIERMLRGNLGEIDRRSISYYTPGSQLVVQVAQREGGPYHPVLSGEAVASYEVDFYPILADAGLLGESYFLAYHDDISKEDEAAAKKAVSTDLRDLALLDYLPGHQFEQSAVLKSCYIDSILAYRLGLPYGIDRRVGPVFDHKKARVAHMSADQVPPVFYNLWVSIGFPDYSLADWDHVHAVRESAAGQDFRRTLERISDSMRKALPEIESEQDVVDLINREFYQELAKELIARRATYEKATLNLAANFVPYAGLVTAIGDFVAAAREESSWVCLLGDYYADSSADFLVTAARTLERPQ